MSDQTAARLKVRKRLLEDFGYYAANALRIRTKQGDIVQLRFNEAQKRLVALMEAQLAQEGKIRLIVLKARQMGLSTAIGAYGYFAVSQRKAQQGIVVTHHADSTKALFDMTKRYHDNCPEALKPSTKYSSRKELKFNKLDSGYTVATAGGEAIGRSQTFTFAHLSELAFWPKTSAKENFNGLTQAIPNAPGTAIFIESTANGVSGQFYDMWQAAMKGENGYIPVFLPWFIQAEYREPVPEGFIRTPDEDDLVAKFGLDDEQLMFRRRKISESGIDLFKQEYPSTPDEAFLTTGRPVFDSQQLAELLSDVPEPLYKMSVQPTADGHEVQKDPRGELLVYRELDPKDTYYIGADVAMGVRGGDYSVAQILDSKKRQVAVWRGHIHPDYFATVLATLGYHYGTAKVIVESNNHGILTCTRLGKDLAYPNFYTETVYDKVEDKETINLGFRTTSKSKPLVIDQLRATMRDKEADLYDRTTLREMQTYIVNDSGNMEAEEGCHDDTVVALALANHIHEGVFTPIVSTDDFYIEAI
jgi:hypothetical protein